MRKLKVGGRESGTVRIAAGETPPEKYAAGELRKYLEKIGIAEAGDGLPVSVGLDPELERDSYAVDAREDGGLKIRGGNGRGVVYGVYAFLERCAGMRFFLPGLETYGEGDVVFEEGFAHTPILEMRQSDWKCGNASVDWCVKNGINEREIPEEMGGHVRYAPLLHSMEALADIPQNEQPCLCDPKIYEKVISRVRRYLAEDPKIRILSVSQNDNRNYCTCPKCAAVDAEEGSHMGTLLRFVNRVAADIAEDYPDVVIDTLAYQYTRKAPKITKPLPNVCIRLCSIECCFSHPLDDPTCSENRAFCRDIVEWNKICSRIYIWDYVTNFHFYVPTFPNFRVLRQNMRFFAEHGVRGMYPEGNFNSPQSGEFGELRCWLLAKLMWDPMMSEEEYLRHMDEFLAAYYGGGWRYLRAYIDWTCAEAAGRHMNIWNPPFDAIPEEKYAAMEETFENWWDKAEELAGDPDRLDAVKRSCLQWRTIRLMLHPDAEEAEKLLAELEARNIRWRETRALPNEKDLSLSPALWK